ncbi:MAG: hypothetical protein IPF92_27920 [Myxococcales bacterium]|nr:hypothetical protein [Myxococcales bacterium]MBL0196330.1 hypothetical protein [Myxococcales bacterium]
MAVDALDLEGRVQRLLTRAAPTALPTLVVAFFTLRAVLRRTGHAAASLDDTYIHFQYARAIVQGHPMRFQAGEPISTGATSQLWPAVLAPFYAMGFRGDALMWPAWVLSFACLAALAYETAKLARGLVSETVAVGAGAMVLTFGGHVWCAASGMEVIPFAWLLARSARRGAEWCEAGPTGRTRSAWLELCALAIAAPLMRPEGALASALLALAVVSNPRRSGLVGRLEGLLPLIGLALTPLLLLALTGKATSSTTQVKLAIGNPYHPLGATFSANARVLFRTILNGEVWSSEFLPRGGAGIAVAGLLAVSIRGVMARKVDRAMAVLALALAMFAPCAYVTFLANRLRYLWPFASGWLVGIACLAELVGALLSRAGRGYAVAGPALAFGVAGMFAMRLDWVIDDVANSASAIARQHGEVARRVRERLPPDARVGLNDTGAIAYFGERKTFDIVGLTTPSEARYWVAGPGSRFEHYERLARDPATRVALPSHFAVYPEWLSCPPVLGERLFEATVRDASILGGPSMQLFRADYTLLGTGEAPVSGFPPVVDALDVGDLESESEHHYALLGAAEGEQVAESGGLGEGAAARRVADGARTNRRREAFWARLAAGRRHVGLVRLRAASDGDGDVTVRVLAGGRDVGGFTASTGEWTEEPFEIPAEAATAHTELTLVAAHGALTVFHYWFAEARTP